MERNGNKTLTSFSFVEISELEVKGLIFLIFFFHRPHVHSFLFLIFRGLSKGKRCNRGRPQLPLTNFQSQGRPSGYQLLRKDMPVKPFERRDKEQPIFFLTARLFFSSFLSFPFHRPFSRNWLWGRWKDKEIIDWWRKDTAGNWFLLSRLASRNFLLYLLFARAMRKKRF